MTIQFTSYDQLDAIVYPFFDNNEAKFWELYSREWDDQDDSRFRDALNWAYRSIADTLEIEPTEPLIFDNVTAVYQYVIDAFKDQLPYALSDDEML